MILPQESVLEKELTKTKSTRAKEKGIHPKKRPRKPKARAGEIPKVIPRLKKRMGPKNVVSPGKTGENTSKDGKKSTENSGLKGKTTETRMAAKQRRFKRDLH